MTDELLTNKALADVDGEAACQNIHPRSFVERKPKTFKTPAACRRLILIVCVCLETGKCTRMNRFLSEKANYEP